MKNCSISSTDHSLADAQRHKPVDAVVVGLGWAGSILAAELTKAGLTVVGIERGPNRSPSGDVYRGAHDELRYAVRSELAQNPATETWTLRHDLTETALPLRSIGSFRPGEGLGGSGIAWGGACWRFDPVDFRLRSHTLERYGPDALPTDTVVQDWPISYDDLEPYYDRFEYMAGTTGRAGNLLGEIREGGNPFEGFRSREYPLPPLKDSHATSLFRAATHELGLHPFPQPVANSSEVYTNPDGIERAACTYCGMCAFHPCKSGAKADPLVTVLPVALGSERFELRTQARVFRIEHDGTRARGVSYYDADGNVHYQPAEVVVLAAYALGNVRLLLLSEMGRPFDPATCTGVVGRGYSYQVMIGRTAFFRDRELKRYMGATGAALCVDDFNGDNFDHADLGFVGGGTLGCGARGGTPITGLALPPGTPQWGLEWKEALRTWYDRSLTVIGSGCVLSYRDNYLDLDPNYRDAWGHPLLRITFNWKQNERLLARYLHAQIGEVLGAMHPTTASPARDLPAHYDTQLYQSTHNCGGAVIGDDPETSVVNRSLQMWDFENVFVVGGSAFPQNSGHGPTGTIGALAYLASEEIATRYAVVEGSLV
jgi:gluconate 2-dehydrogenase alpha chain